ncbi:MAG TPA: biotin--[acetyl-CoA-carboxylase] ligase [Candidatus Limnocylindria bacterium]|nr:biotin--[acetyl-CoA-carboxylase] ligase [Candidatus Limnocylindria bacterium]
MNDASWSAAADPSRRIGRTIEFHAEIGSSNDRAREALASGAGDGLAVVADLQTAGRGRRGRTWSSPAGVNLMVSVGVRPRIEGSDAGLLGIACAMAVRDACAAQVPAADLRVRWPNDVVDDDGRKLAGLLVETAMEDGRLAEAVVGIGINVNWYLTDMPRELRDRATSLVELAGHPIDRVTLLSAVLAALDGALTALERGKSPLARLARVSALDGRQVTVDLGTERLVGMAAGVSEHGLLLLDTDAGRVALAVGEVVAVRDAPQPDAALRVGSGA